MQTHGVSDADVTKRQLGWYLRNCAESAFAEDIKHLLAPALGLLTGEVESKDGHDDDEDDLDLLGLDLPQSRPPSGKPIDLTQLRRVLRTFVAAPKGSESLEQNVAYARKNSNSMHSIRRSCCSSCARSGSRAWKRWQMA
jgi:hypothetical protein